MLTSILHMIAAGHAITADGAATTMTSFEGDQYTCTTKDVDHVSSSNICSATCVSVTLTSASLGALGSKWLKLKTFAQDLTVVETYGNPTCTGTAETTFTAIGEEAWKALEGSCAVVNMATNTNQVEKQYIQIVNGCKAFTKSCVQWDMAGLPCPHHLRPSSYLPGTTFTGACMDGTIGSSDDRNQDRDRHGATACPILVDPSSQHSAQAGFTIQTWPALTRTASQAVIITCGANLKNTFANVGCTTASTAFLAIECPPLDYDGVHVAEAGKSTSSAAFTDGPNTFTLTVNTAGLNAGEHRLCIDLDGTAGVAKFNDAGLIVSIA